MSRTLYESAASIYSLVLLILLTPVHGIVFALDDSSKLPENARAKSFGSGWECEHGYREANGTCAAIKVPKKCISGEYILRKRLEMWARISRGQWSLRIN